MIEPIKKDASLMQVKSLLTNCTYLEDSGVTIDGIKIYGSPWQPTYGTGGGAFQVERNGEKIREVCSKFPSDADILLTHGPPLGFRDRNVGGEHCGCEETLKAVVGRVNPKYHVFGHIHEGGEVAFPVRSEHYSLFPLSLHPSSLWNVDQRRDDVHQREHVHQGSSAEGEEPSVRLRSSG